MEIDNQWLEDDFVEADKVKKVREEKVKEVEEEKVKKVKKSKKMQKIILLYFEKSIYLKTFLIIY